MAASVRRLGEIGLIDRFARRLHRPSSVAVGIGDDAAILRLPGAKEHLVFASDMLVEGVHFRRADVPLEAVGWKALASNISDVAAMGGRPHWAVVSLGLPRSTRVDAVDALYRGLERCARRFDVAIVGGDTVRAPQLVVDVAILGTVGAGQEVLRSGGRPGDAVFVTGRLGGSLASGRHATFTPRLREAHALLRRVRLHAMMDLSDGLAIDLWRMSRASRVRFELEAARIPRSSSSTTLEGALTDGEDFELLFTVAARDAHRVPRRIGQCAVTRIGAAVSRGVGVTLAHADGRRTPLKPAGFQHF